MAAGALTAVEVTSFAIAAPARADEAAESRLAFELGETLLRQRRYGAALDRFLESNRLVPTGGAAANAAYCYERLRRPEDAFNAYQEALRLGLPDRDGERARRRAARLRRRIAVVDVTVTPDDARLYVDRVELGSVGQGSGPLAVRPGQHTLIARRNGWHDAAAPLQVTRGDTIALELVLELQLAPLRVSSTPPGATVVDVASEEVLGTTPLQQQSTPGTRELRLELEGWRPQQRPVTIAEEDGGSWSAALERDPLRWAALSVEGAPAGAQVSLDGAAVGTTPLSVERLDLGTHLLEVTAAGHEPWAGDVVLEGGGTTRVDVFLRDPDSAPQEELLWIGYGAGGALLGSGVGLAVAAAQAREDFESDPNPVSSDLDRVERLNRFADGFLFAGLGALAVTVVVDLLLHPPPPSHADVRLDR